MRSKNVVYNISTNLLLQIFTIIYGFILPKIIISNFGSSTNGLISSITQFLGYIALLESGFGPVIKSILYKPIANKDKKTIENILKSSEKFFKTISNIFIIYIIVLSILYPLIVNSEFSYLYTISLILIISIGIFAEYYFGMTYRLYLQAEQKAYVISLIQIFTYLFSIIIVVILAKLNASIHIIKLFSSLIFILRPLLQNIYVKKKYNINLKNANENYKINQKWDGLAQHIAAVVHNNTDITILTFFCTLSEVSVYSVYYLVVRGVKILIQSFTNGIDAVFGNMLAKNEWDNLNKKFNIYEVLYYIVTCILFTSTIILIVPFVKVYTRGITDINYVRYIFGYLIVISEYIWAIRLPYSSITLAAGHFKETRKGAWVEALLNIIISIFLVKKYGIIGVAIGTIVAMTIRTFEFVYHTNKYILKRSVMAGFSKILIVIIESIVVFFICKLLPYVDNTNYLNWIINAIMVFVCTTLIVIVFNIVFYRKDLKHIKLLFKDIFKRKRI